MSFTFQVLMEISDERVKDLLCCGLESGDYGSFEIVEYSEGADVWEFPHLDLPFNNGAVYLRDRYEGGEVLKLDRAALEHGFNILNDKYPRIMADFLKDNEDALTGDAFLQCALLGEVVYG